MEGGNFTLGTAKIHNKNLEKTKVPVSFSPGVNAEPEKVEMTIPDSPEIYETTPKIELDPNRLGNKLSKYLTELDLEDPKLVEKLISDHERIRAKYHLPPEGLKSHSPSEYERALRIIGKLFEVEIKNKNEFGKFFEENQVGAVYFDETNKIGININKQNLKSYLSSLNQLEHELIHAFQKKDASRMPIELQEYEAYIATGNMKMLQEDPEAVEMVFQHLIGGSVEWWYENESKKTGATITPEWDKN